MNVSSKKPSTVFEEHSHNMKCFLGLEMADTSDTDTKPSVTNFVYQHQIKAIKKINKFFTKPENKCGCTLAVLPTGCGKTGIAVLSAYVLAAKRVLVVTPSLIIKEQMENNFFCKKNGYLVKRKIIADSQTHVLPPRFEIGKAKDIHKFFDSTNPIMVVNIQKFGEKSISDHIETIPKDKFDLVIVDEAHHYPAATWTRLINHFEHAKRLFLTATPKYKGEDITYVPPGKTAPEEIHKCYTYPKEDAIRDGVIRDVKFVEEPANNEDHAMASYKVAIMIIKYLKDHDKLDKKNKHQAMVLLQTIKTDKPEIPSAKVFEEQYNIVAETEGEGKCAIYASGSSKEVLERFDDQRDQLRTLVVVGRLIEGYDNKNVSVVAIVRNVGIKSRVLFSQFVGRAVRRLYKDDPVDAVVISHECYKQRKNFELFRDPEILDEENEDED